ncbi:hypothetical protein L9F63_020089 [Diploptera punctata]|uniref:Salivary secreted peptide n=1 Tax=Diploptera punctata TaxID=6984 RepID=A0AAD7ZSU1_DIPPU|nr:hypothetical protein L9F63_020089 [Diploptera punctata]
MAVLLCRLACLILLLTWTQGFPSSTPSDQYPPIPFDDSPEKPLTDSNDKTSTHGGYTKPSLKYLQKLLIDALHPKPIVDTIREEEKYGNDGGQLAVVGRGIVAGVENITNFISSAFDIPFETLKGLSRKATETLNNIGGKIVGI